jgi:NMD protein affecting ribosome stability and mRNA decay
MTRPPHSISPGRRISGRAQDDHIRDPYQVQHKPPEPATCQNCGAVYQHGRWQWGKSPEGAHRELCPACRRIADALPAGIVTLQGPFTLEHKNEITGLVHNEEAAEKAEHPLNRIMAIANIENGIEVQTTDIHLPRRIGTALKRAFDGELEMHFDEAGYFVRVDWRRPA